MENQDAYGFSKDKLPNTLSYPLKRSHLDAALSTSGVLGQVYSVRYLHRESQNLLDVIYSPVATGAFAAGRSLITLYAVPSDARRATEAVILSKGLPLLCQWLARVASAGNSYRWTGHIYSLRLEDGTVRAIESQR